MRRGRGFEEGVVEEGVALGVGVGELEGGEVVVGCVGRVGDVDYERGCEGVVAAEECWVSAREAGKSESA